MQTQIWNWIPATDFEVPAAPATDAARGSARRLWQSLRRIIREPASEPAEIGQDWSRPAAAALQSVAPRPDWNPAVQELRQLLSTGLNSPTRRLRSVVTAPGICTHEILQQLAQHQQLTLLPPPDQDSLLTAVSAGWHQTATDHRDDKDRHGVLVVPGLERWFLRHADGLTSIRELVQWLRDSPQHIVLSCDSWAWEFLQHAIGIEDQLGPPLTLQAFDAQRLQAWLSNCVNRQQNIFRQARGREPIFPDNPPGQQPDAKRQPPTPSAWVSSLAAVARGNPGVAIALWNACLRHQLQESSADNAAENESTQQSDKQTDWLLVSPSDAVPQLPAHIDRVHRCILHVLLLHAGLPYAVLPKLLPFSQDEIRRRVAALSHAGIVDDCDGRLVVSLVAYPGVRRDLSSEGFLTDRF